MTESLIAPEPASQGAGNDVAPPSSRNEGPEQQAAVDPSALLYRGPDAEAGEAAEATDREAPPADEQVPVTYEPFELPQGVEVDSAALEEAQSLFAEARLSQPQAQKLVDLYAGKMNELVQRQIATQISAAQSRQTAWVAEVKNDPELGGRRFEQARAAAQRALNRFGTPELRRTLDELWVGNNPQLFRFFVRVGQAVSEDRYAGTRSSAPTSAADTLYPQQTKE